VKGLEGQGSAITVGMTSDYSHAGAKPQHAVLLDNIRNVVAHMALEIKIAWRQKPEAPDHKWCKPIATPRACGRMCHSSMERKVPFKSGGGND